MEDTGIEIVKPRPEVLGVLAEVEEQRAISETQGAMIIAKRFPRDPVQALDKIINACTRVGLAEAALYQYSRGGTDITGPSIRLAEAIAQHWGNLQFGVRELEQKNGSSTVQTFAWDVETNTRQVKEFQVAHKRFTKKGSYSLEDPRDIYEMVANQGARRLRACILGIIPGDVVESAVKQCEATLKTKANVTPERITSLLEKFAEYQVTKEQIETRIQRHLDAMTPAQLVNLGKIYNSLKDGMSTPSDWFEGVQAPAPEKPKAEEKTEALKEKLRGRPKKTAQEPQAKTPPAPAIKEPEKVDPEPSKPIEQTEDKDLWGEIQDGKGEEQPPESPPATEEPVKESKFLTECRNYYDALNNTNWAIITRYFGVAGKKPEDVDKELPEEAKIKFIDQCKKGLAKQNG